jgi:hypothetical protein
MAELHHFFDESSGNAGNSFRFADGPGQNKADSGSIVLFI